ncbi:MAG: esterase [Elusimicrobia bacterium]|nr:esterase [Elusimicrobiota bacterium]
MSNGVNIQFTVKVPSYTVKDDSVFISGNIPEFGNWDPGKIKLDKAGDFTYQKKFSLPKDIKTEFKFTRGNWEMVEKGKDGEELSNREMTIVKDEKIEFTILNWADNIKIEKKHTLTGNIKFHENFHSKKLNNKRSIIVYLPPDYEKNIKKIYPVLYMHDGQNIFDSATSFTGIEWAVDETVEKLISESKIKEIIIVGIYNNSDRVKEYTPYPDKKHGGGDADKYADFIINDLKPFIDKTYRTLQDRNNTAIMGSSLGGIVSLYIIWKYPEIFSMSGVVSPALWWADYKIFDEIKKSPKKKIKIYFDMGTKEGDTMESFNSAISDVRKLHDILIKQGFVLGKDLEYFEDEGAVHNESAWAKRVHKPLLFFFGK